MAIKYAIDKFPIGYPAKTLASSGGAYIYNITLKEDTPNGVFIGKGKFLELDRYEEGAAGSVTGKIVGKAANGNYYVEIDTVDADTLFVSTIPVIDEEFTKVWQKEENFYNPSGTEARCYQLEHGAIIEVNKAALGLSTDPTTYPQAVTATAYDGSSYAKALN